MSRKQAFMGHLSQQIDALQHHIKMCPLRKLIIRGGVDEILPCVTTPSACPPIITVNTDLADLSRDEDCSPRPAQTVAPALASVLHQALNFLRCKVLARPPVTI